MGHVPLLDELAIVAALAVFVTVVLSRLKPGDIVYFVGTSPAIREAVPLFDA